VDYNEKILIRKNKSEMIVRKIGEFIDEIHETYDKKYQEYYEKGDQTLIKVNEQNENYDIWAVDWDGKYKWKELQSVTKHLPLVDGKRDKLVKITLESKRTAIGTKAKSFLRYNKETNKLEPVGGDKIEVGDYVPITKHFEIKEQLKYLDLEPYFPKTKYYYTNEIIKGLEHKKKLGKRNWFKGYNGKEFTVPYLRSDIMIDGIKGRFRKGNFFKQGYFYDKNNGAKGLKLPETLELDELFGFFIGAYLAEGLANKNQVKISNNDKDFRNKIYDFCDKYEIPYYTTKREFGTLETKLIDTYTFRNRNEKIDDKETTFTQYDKTKNYRNGISTDITIYHTLLAKLLKQLCNTGSKNKKVPEFCYLANEEFIKGLLDGYLSGDGTLNKTTFCYTTISEDLGYGIALLLKRFGIHTKIFENQRKYNRYWTFTLKNYSRFRYLKLTHKEKMWRLFKHQDRKENPLTYFGDNVLEKVIEKEEIESSHKYVYDLTIKDNPTFIGFNGVSFMDTFHSSGVSSKTKVNQGVPRLREIISATKNPKTPSMTVHLTTGETNRDKTKEMLNKLQYVPLNKFVNNVEIWYDKDILNSVIEKDRDFVRSYYNFYDDYDIRLLSPWVLRIEINHQTLFDKQIDMFYLYKKILNYLPKDIYKVIFSNDNSDIGKLVFHIRLVHSHTLDKKGNVIEMGIDMKDEENNYLTMNDYNKLISLESNLLENLIIMGIKGIDKVYIREYKKITYKRDGTKEYKPRYVLDTVGCNLREILNMELDANRTISNQIHEVHEVLGIEAARNLILREINGVLKASGIYLNQKHLYLLCDIMTNKGYIQTIDRHGMNKSDIGPLAKCSFEETDDQLTKAAIFSHIDTMNSIASSLIMGQMGNFGTGMVELDMELNFEDNN
jgi:DNA-directed RNA polymerase beta' subunit